MSRVAGSLISEECPRRCAYVAEPAEPARP